MNFNNDVLSKQYELVNENAAALDYVKQLLQTPAEKAKEFVKRVKSSGPRVFGKFIANCFRNPKAKNILKSIVATA